MASSEPPLPCGNSSFRRGRVTCTAGFRLVAPPIGFVLLRGGAPGFFFAPLLAVGAVVGAPFSTIRLITDIAEGSAVGLRSASPGTLPMPRKHGPLTPLSEWSRLAPGDPRLTSW